MPVAPTGMISLPLSYLRATLAASETFQTLAGAADAAAALAHIKLIEGPPTSIAVVGLEQGFTRTASSGGARSYFEGDVGLELILRIAVADGATDADAFYTGMNTAGAIQKEMEALAGTAGYLDITAMTLKEGPARPFESERATIGDFIQCIWSVRAGEGV